MLPRLQDILITCFVFPTSILINFICFASLFVGCCLATKSLNLNNKLCSPDRTAFALQTLGNVTCFYSNVTAHTIYSEFTFVGYAIGPGYMAGLAWMHQTTHREVYCMGQRCIV